MRITCYLFAIVTISLCVGSTYGAVIGSDKGWEMQAAPWDDVTPDNSIVDVEIDAAPEDILAIEFGKVYSESTVPFAVLDSIVVSFHPIEGEDQASMIFINDEQITNNTGYEWKSFKMVLLNAHPDTQFDISYMQKEYFGSALLSDDGQTILFSSGAVADGLTMHLDNIIINVSPDEDVFRLKEAPEIPEPATMSLLAVGGIAALRRRRRR